MLRGIPGVLANERRRQARPPCWPRPLAAGMCQRIALPVIGQAAGIGGVCGEAHPFPHVFGFGSAPSSAIRTHLTLLLNGAVLLISRAAVAIPRPSDRGQSPAQRRC